MTRTDNKDAQSTIEKVLAMLRTAPGMISGGAMAAQLGISRAAIWKQISVLRRLGYLISARDSQGYCLEASPNAALPVEMALRLHGCRLGQPYHYLYTTPSTNAVLAQLAVQGAPEGTLVVAEQQQAGRGRMARGWHSPPRVGLYFSLLLKPQVEMAQITTLPLLVGLAVSAAVRPYLGAAQPLLKWPNDVLLDGRKICGVLCEAQAEATRIQYIIVGIGLNVNHLERDFPQELRGVATSVKLAGGCDVSRPDLLATLLSKLDTMMQQWQNHGLAPFLPELQERDALRGRQITIERARDTISGVADGVANDGALRLLTREGRLELIYSGDAHIHHKDWGGACKSPR